MGANGRAWKNIEGMSAVPNTTLVAVAEVDDARLNLVKEHFPDARVYRDWRKLLDKEAKNLDAVMVSTPDHMHAPMAMTAMQAGLHVYCEKPLARTVFEARALRNYAEENNIVTQLGNQRSQGTDNRTVVNALRNGIVGTVKEIHCMQAKSWGSMEALSDSGQAIPESLDWDLWIGGGPMRPYVAEHFHPFAWRGRLNYGCGNLGDMGCHLFHPWFMGLEPDAPLSVESLGPGPANRDSWPTDVRVRWEFPGSIASGGENFTVTWHDGGQMPPAQVAEAVGGAENVPTSGSIIIGSEGALISPHGPDGVKLFVGGVQEVDAVETVTGSDDHHGNFADAVRGENGGRPPLCHFGHGGKMTEAVLVGTCAVRVPGVKLEWDAGTLTFSNSKEANHLVREEYRQGWNVAGL